MIFIYLFVLSTIGITIVLIIERKRTPKNLLQIIKSSCSIDSVRFEKQLRISQITSRTIRKYLYYFFRTCLKKVREYVTQAVNKLKLVIRKRLHSDITNKTPSDFISKIKKD
jgi:hypothetical protein